MTKEDKYSDTYLQLVNLLFINFVVDKQFKKFTCYVFGERFFLIYLAKYLNITFKRISNTNLYIFLHQYANIAYKSWIFNRDTCSDFCSRLIYY